MRQFNVTLAVCVDTNDDSQVAQALIRALRHQEGSELDAVKVLTTRKHPQIPALCCAPKGTIHDRNHQR